MIKRRVKRKMSVFRYLALGFLLVILIGSVLLVLPAASAEGEEVSYLDALFTSVSATCVTGLTPVVTGAQWSLFGQIVLLVLVQLGGLGFMTFVSVIILMVRGGLGLYAKTAVLQSVGGFDLAHVKKTIKWIFLGTALFETLGACILMFRFIPDFGAGRGIYYSVWYSISAFCSSGFDLLVGEGGSLTRYATDPVVSVTIPVLVILGGLGFCVWGDVIKCRFNPKKFHFYTKLVLTATAIILVVSTFLILLFERNHPQMQNYSFGQKLLCSFFHATMTRTGGYYTIDQTALSDSGFLLSVVLMFIGACSGSMGGGIKVSTFVVVVTGMVSVFRGDRDINIGKHRLEASLLGRALAICTCYLVLIVTATLVICAIEPNGADSFRQILYETVSALGTVGLSMGITPALGAASKCILILLMYTGRVGVLTLAFALGRKRDAAEVRRPVSTLFIG